MERFAAWFSELEEGRGKPVAFGDTAILLVRQGQDVRAVEGKCPHAGAPLDKGAVCDGVLVCPWHMGAFRLSDGAWLEPPPLRSLRTYPARVAGDEVWVELEPPAPPLPPCRAATQHITLVGAGAAAVAAMETLREQGFAGTVALVAPQPEEPVDRTLLSKQALAGQWDLAKLPLWQQGDLVRLDIARFVGTVAELDVATRRLRFEDGRAFDVDAVLIAPGGVPQKLRVPGADLPGVSTIRHAADVRALLDAARGTERAVVVGTSFIGMEAAAALRELGLSVTVIGKGKDLPFERLLGRRVGQALTALHERKGVAFRLGAEVARMEGGTKVEAVVLGSGERLPAGVVVVGVGVRPATGFLRGLTLDEDGGVPVNRRLRALPSTRSLRRGVWAAGDVAAVAGSPRIEHWRVAQQHGRAAALDMLGEGDDFSGVPFFWSAQHGYRIDLLGQAPKGSDPVVDGDLDGMNFLAYYVEGEQVRAVLSAGRETATAWLCHKMRGPLTLDEARAGASAFPA